jgi:hypothetical protein
VADTPRADAAAPPPALRAVAPGLRAPLPSPVRCGAATASPPPLPALASAADLPFAPAMRVAADGSLGAPPMPPPRAHVRVDPLTALLNSPASTLSPVRVAASRLPTAATSPPPGMHLDVPALHTAILAMREEAAGSCGPGGAPQPLSPVAWPGAASGSPFTPVRGGSSSNLSVGGGSGAQWPLPLPAALPGIQTPSRRLQRNLTAPPARTPRSPRAGAASHDGSSHGGSLYGALHGSTAGFMVGSSGSGTQLYAPRGATAPATGTSGWHSAGVAAGARAALAAGARGKGGGEEIEGEGSCPGTPTSQATVLNAATSPFRPALVRGRAAVRGPSQK